MKTNMLISIFLLLGTFFSIPSCKISDCRKAEEAVYAQYRQAMVTDSSFDFTNMRFDCKGRSYSKKYLLKHLGKPFRIYIKDKGAANEMLYEDWIYIVKKLKYTNEKPWIASLLVLKLDLGSSKLIDYPGCNAGCTDYRILNAANDIYTHAIFRVNSDSFDIKYPYIIKNEQRFYD
jgi:hypothetical protein